MASRAWTAFYYPFSLPALAPDDDRVADGWWVFNDGIAKHESLKTTWSWTPLSNLQTYILWIAWSGNACRWCDRSSVVVKWIKFETNERLWTQNKLPWSHVPSSGRFWCKHSIAYPAFQRTCAQFSVCRYKWMTFML